MASEAKNDPGSPAEQHPPIPPTPDSLARVFLIFLRFGFLAWGGPTAQIAMIRAELVDRLRWVTSERFNRALAVYQVMPGPEAFEMCCWIAHQRRGRAAGFLAGLGFMLPGLVLMLLASWAYFLGALSSAVIAAAFAACQPAVVALVVRAVHKLGSHAIRTREHLIVALLALLATRLGVHFAIALIICGTVCSLAAARKAIPARVLAVVFAVVCVGVSQMSGPDPSAVPDPVPTSLSSPAQSSGAEAAPRDESAVPGAAARAAPSNPRVFLVGLQAGSLTFGGAYTAIPFVRSAAVESDSAWMSRPEFLDSLALGGILPAPLVIFTTFVGYSATGLPGALLATLGTFLPAFLFTLVFHKPIERLIAHTPAHAFLDGVAAGVIGIIASTTLDMLAETFLPDARLALRPVLFFAAASAALWSLRNRMVPMWVILGAGCAGILLHVVGL